MGNRPSSALFSGERRGTTKWAVQEAGAGGLGGVLSLWSELPSHLSSQAPADPKRSKLRMGGPEPLSRRVSLLASTPFALPWIEGPV